MQTELEKYLKEKRLLLDVDQPDEDSVWEGIKAGMEKKRKVIPLWLWRVAAVFLFAALTTYLVINESRQKQIVFVTLSDVSKELGEQEAQLQTIANQKWNEVQPMLINTNDEFRFLLDELEELEDIYHIYQQDLNEIGANEFIIHAMLDYHEKKIRILDRLLLEIQKQKDHEETITL